MTKAELIKALEKFPDDKQITFTLPGAKTIYWADKLTDYKGFPVIESIDSVNFEDIAGMAEKCLEETETIIGHDKAELLKEFIIGAEVIEHER